MIPEFSDNPNQYVGRTVYSDDGFVRGTIDTVMTDERRPKRIIGVIVTLDVPIVDRRGREQTEVAWPRDACKLA